MYANIAMSHSWYDPACCSNQDCYSTEVKPFNKSMVEFQTKSGVLIVDLEQQRDKIKPSQDRNWHICINQGKLICIYQPDPEI